MEYGKKFCKHCGERIDIECVVCPKCGKQVEELKTADRNIVINNSSSASAAASANTGRPIIVTGRPKNKTTALILCMLFGYFGAHKFYEGKTGMGLLYLFTFGLVGIGWIIDILVLLGKPNPYYV